jgi:hypothetical protein
METLQTWADKPDVSMSWPMLALTMPASVKMETMSAAWPTSGKAVSVVFAPGVTHQEAMARVAGAGGIVVYVGGLLNIVIAIRRPTNETPRFRFSRAARIYARTLQ